MSLSGVRVANDHGGKRQKLCIVRTICYGDSFIAMADLYYMNQISLKIAYMDTDCVANGLILCENELQK